jgi:hypothetical protein
VIARDSRRQRERQPERRAAVRIVASLDRAVMCLDDPASNRQSYSHALGFRGEKWLEEPRERVRRDPRDPVFY